MAVRKGYKLTEIGEIPEDWEIMQVENLCTISTGTKNTQDNDQNGNYPFFVRSQKIERINSYSYDGEGVLTAGDGVGTGKVFHYINGKFDFHQRVYLLANFNNVCNGYYFYLYFSSFFYDRIMQMTAKSSVDSIRREMIAKMQIPIPSLAEQTAIASALSDMDSLIESLERLIAKKKLVKQGAIRELLTGKRRLLGFEGEWEESTLGLLTIIKDGTHQTPNYTDFGVPFYSVENITNNNFYNNIKFISKKDHNVQSRNYKIERDDILMTRIGILGECKLVDWDFDASFYVSIVLVKIIDKGLIYPKYLFYYMNTDLFKDDISKLALPNAIPPKINLGEISNLVIRYPSFNEQTAIASVLSDMDAEIDALTAKLAKLRKIKSGMMSELLTGRTRLI